MFLPNKNIIMAFFFFFFFLFLFLLLALTSLFNLHTYVGDTQYYFLYFMKYSYYIIFTHISIFFLVSFRSNIAIDAFFCCILCLSKANHYEIFPITIILFNFLFVFSPIIYLISMIFCRFFFLLFSDLVFFWF